MQSYNLAIIFIIEGVLVVMSINRKSVYVCYYRSTRIDKEYIDVPIRPFPSTSREFRNQKIGLYVIYTTHFLCVSCL